MKRLLCTLLCLILIIPCAAAETAAMQACLSITGNYTFNIPADYIHINAERAARVSEGMTAEEITSEFGVPLQDAEELLMEEGAASLTTQDVIFAPEYPGAILFSLLPDSAIADIESYSQQLAASTTKHYVALGATEAECINLGKLDIEDSDIEWYGYTAPLDSISCFHFYGNYGSDVMLITFNQISEDVVWPVLQSFRMVKTPDSDLAEWLDMFSVPDFTLEDGVRFESLHGRYSFTLPAGSTQYALRDMAEQFNTGTASLRIRGVDCYGLMSDTELHIESVTTPHTGIFRSDMEARSDSMIAGFVSQYTESGYPEEDLDIRYEEIGGRPFLSIHTANDPYDAGEYYTYSTTGTKYYFVFYYTTDAQERAILETLQLDEPTYVLLDTTSLTGLAQGYADMPAEQEMIPFTSEGGLYTISLPKGSYHYTSEEIQDEFGLPAGYISMMNGDFYSIYESDYYDLYSYVSKMGGFVQSSLTDSPDSVIEYVLYMTEADDVAQENIQCEIIAIGERLFARAHYTPEGYYSAYSDYYTYDDAGTEYFFCFYDTTFEEEFAILNTLQLTEPEKPAPVPYSAPKNSTIDKLKKKDDAADSDESSDSQPKLKMVENDYLSISLPYGLLPFDSATVDALHRMAIASIESAGGDTTIFDNLEYMEVYSTILYKRTVELQVGSDPTFSREQIAGQDEAVIPGIRDLIASTKQPYSDIEPGFVTLGGNDFVYYTGVAYGAPIICFTTVSEDGLEISVLFTGYSFDEACRCVETLIIK